MTSGETIPEIQNSRLPVPVAMDTWKRVKLIATDRLKYDPICRAAAGRVLQILGSFQKSADSNKAAMLLLRMTFAARLLGRDRAKGTLESRIAKLAQQWSPAGFDWDRFFPNSKRQLVQKAIILKSPKPHGEKGALFVAFEDNWLRLFRYADLNKLAEQYDLVISPTWSPPYDLPFLIACQMWPSTLLTIVSNLDDLPVFQRLTPCVIPIPLLASSWVNPDTFSVQPTPEKKYDVAILATFANYKRHFALFRAASQMRRKPRILVLGHAWGGRSRAVLEEEARLFGVLDWITFAEALPDTEMFRALQSSRVSVIMSLGEGSCVAVAESLFANVPVALIGGANVGSRAFINNQTGCFLRPGHIAEDLELFIQRSAEYAPRSWMLARQASHRDSSRTLNLALKDFAEKEARPWTTDIAAMHWRPNAEFDSAIARESMRPEYERFEKEFGIPVQLGPR